jgi:hypothetical protein
LAKKTCDEDLVFVILHKVWLQTTARSAVCALSINLMEYVPLANPISGIFMFLLPNHWFESGLSHLALGHPIPQQKNTDLLLRLSGTEARC